MRITLTSQQKVLLERANTAHAQTKANLELVLTGIVAAADLADAKLLGGNLDEGWIEVEDPDSGSHKPQLVG